VKTVLVLDRSATVTGLKLLWVIKIRRMSIVGNVARMAARQTQSYMHISKGIRLLGKPMHRWGNNIKTELTELRWEGLEWVHLAHDSDQ
jgi:hypothetical protein